MTDSKLIALLIVAAIALVFLFGLGFLSVYGPVSGSYLPVH